MKLLISTLIIWGCTIGNADAGQLKDTYKFKLSPTATIAWKKAEPIGVYPSVAGSDLMLSGTLENTSYTVWVKRVKGRVLAHEKYVEREWKMINSLNKKKWTEQKCEKHSPIDFVCSRESKDAKHRVLEKIYWNGLDDVVVLRYRFNDQNKNPASLTKIIKVALGHGKLNSRTVSSVQKNKKQAGKKK